jgi:uncharacterized protein YndB with AHSA1/START domain
MTRILSSAEIARPIDAVFEYVTTPGNWPAWHPSSLAVRGATDHSLAVGEQVTEEYRVAGQEGTVTWTVTERAAPRRWTIAGTTAQTKTRGVVAYTLAETPGGTHFERVFNYDLPDAPLPEEMVREYERRVQAESDEAVRRLKAALEG